LLYGYAGVALLVFVVAVVPGMVDGL